MRLRKTFLLGILCSATLLFNFSEVLAQDFDYDPDPNYEKYLNDGRVMGKNNIAAINASALISGFVSGNYTRKLTDKMSVSLVGELHLFQKHIAPWTYRLNDNREGDIPISGGRGFGVSFGYYPYHGAIDHAYGIELSYRNRVLTGDNNAKLTSNEFCFAYSRWWLYYNNLAIGTDFFYGFNTLDTKGDFLRSGPFDNEYSSFLIGLRFKVGMYF